ncbi:MAG: Na/Pi cotransporter family protein [Anaerolineales bacterium]
MLTVITVLGGLALFQYGVRVLSQGMEQLAGGKMQQWLDRATNRRFTGAIFGIIATALLQSSSLLTVTMIGLANGGLMTLAQAIGVMLGQEIGTTITGQVISFDIGVIRYLALVAGFLMAEFGKHRSMQRYGQVLLGLGVLFIGMETMQGALKPLAQSPQFSSWLSIMGQSPLLGVLAGALFTAAIQSSSATTALVIALGASNLVTLPGAISLIYGANIGTCITGYLASLRATVVGKRVSIAQILINVFGVLLFLPFITPYSRLLQLTAGTLPRQIANAHTIFNITVSAILFPFVHQIERLTALIVPDRSVEVKPPVTRYINDEIRGVPSIAILESAKEVGYMGETVVHMLDLSRDALLHGDLTKAEEVLRLEREVVDPLCDAIERYVDGIIAEDLAEDEREKCFQIKNINVDLERVGDHAENLAEAAQDRVYHEVPFTDEALADLDHAFAHVRETLVTALNAVRTGSHEEAMKACRMEDEMDRINLSARQAHMTRVQLHECNTEAGVIFIESLRNLERIGDHADNLAVSVLRK